MKRRRATRYLSVAVLSVAAVSLHSPAWGVYEPPSEEVAPAAGEALYRRDCASCHGPSGEGSRRGSALTDTGEAASYYYLHTGRMPITSPDEPIRRSPVPYDSHQLASLVAFSASLGQGEPMPRPRTVDTDLGGGGESYRLHCSVCHGAAGEGGALAERRHSPGLGHATTEEVVAAMIAGPGVMPSFANALQGEELLDVAAYVEHLQDPPGTGLAVPGHRVGEGLVAMLATGLIVVVARLVGESA